MVKALAISYACLPQLMIVLLLREEIAFHEDESVHTVPFSLVQFWKRVKN